MVESFAARELTIGNCVAEDCDQRPTSAPAPLVSDPQSLFPLFDAEEALSRCFNSKDLMLEMVRCFLDEVDKLFPRMRAALEQGDLAEVGHLGHRLKGSLVYLGAQRAKEAAQRVERFCTAPGTPAEAGGSHQQSRRPVPSTEGRLGRASAAGRDGATRLAPEKAIVRKSFPRLTLPSPPALAVAGPQT